MSKKMRKHAPLHSFVTCRRARIPATTTSYENVRKKYYVRSLRTRRSESRRKRVLCVAEMFLVHLARFGYWAENDDMREGLLDRGSDSQVQIAAENGDVNELGRLRELGCQWTAQTCAEASENGHLRCLQYLHENGCPWDTRTCAYAARYGYPECLQYAHENGCPWDTMTCAGAALNGDLECLQYLHENGCPWDEETCTHAAFSGSLQCLQYAHEHGCPWDTRVFELANQRNNFEILQFARDHGLQGVIPNREVDLRFIPEETQQILAVIGAIREMPNETYRDIAEMLVELAQYAREHELEGEDVIPNREEVIGFVRGKARRILAAVDEVTEIITDQAYRTIAERLQRIHDTR